MFPFHYCGLQQLKIDYHSIVSYVLRAVARLLFRLWFPVTGTPPINARPRHRIILVLITPKSGATLPHSQLDKFLGLLAISDIERKRRRISSTKTCIVSVTVERLEPLLVTQRWLLVIVYRTFKSIRGYIFTELMPRHYLLSAFTAGVQCGE
ncbi:hypothetical protein CPB85DRAFT_98049 [Mucidula mucida]|nr:hypothetical protein CPB85DRAFT_98049 [Mucidula mucida]